MTIEGFQSGSELTVIILAGGAGTRFWPVSTQERPKQFLSFFGPRSMLQQTYDRVKGLVSPDRIFILTNKRYVPLVNFQLPEIPRFNVIGEPQPRNTSAAIALAGALCRRRFGNPVMVVLPADHLIYPVGAFQRTIMEAVRAASTVGGLFTFGITPTFPSTGYGYLEHGRKLDLPAGNGGAAVEMIAEMAVEEATEAEGGAGIHELLSFKEKPDLETARSYVKSQRYSWNSGIFVWRVNDILDELERYLPGHTRRIFPLAEADGQPDWEEALFEAYDPLPKISIDFGVMEKAKRVRMIRAGFQWSDVGGWLVLEKFLPLDPSGNSARGQVKSYDSRGNLVFCEEETETVALVGVENLVVVRAGDKTLVVHRDRTEQVKNLVEGLGINTPVTESR
ncbi:MAG: NTP transferase domain-containing protein [Firmicutes bacterium]|nr:NTP transferase domain-containing protein [Bacillota bacterium]